MLILGIDPGPRESAMVGLWRGDSGQWSISYQGDAQDNRTLCDFVGVEAPVTDGVAIEFPVPYDKLGQNILDTAAWCGKFEFQADGRALRITRPEVLYHLCGKNSGLSKPQVKVALSQRLWGCDPREAKGTKKSPGPCHGFKGAHVWDALAVAVVLAERLEAQHE